MVFTALQTTQFFDQHIGISNATREWLRGEGITTVIDLGKFTNKNWTTVFSKALKPQWVANGNGQMIQAPPPVMPTKAQEYLEQASNMVRYHTLCGRAISAGNMNRELIKEYNHALDILTKMQESNTDNAPAFTKAGGILEWFESMKLHLQNRVGERDPPVPLAYVVRENVQPGAPPALANDKPYSDQHGSVVKELIARTSHHHHEFQTDNELVYSILLNALQNTAYGSALKPYEDDLDGRAAWMSLVSQYAGVDKWKKITTDCKSFIQNRKWYGTSTQYSLEQYIQQHRSAYHKLNKCSKMIPTEIPSEHTRVTFLLDNIENSDQRLTTAIMNILGGDITDEDDKLNDFESAAAYILPHDPTKRLKTTNGKRKHATISTLEVAGEATKHKTMTLNGKKVKVGIGKTGVDIRYHTPDEYYKLTPAQKQELQQIRDNRKSKGISTKLPGGPNHQSRSHGSRKSFKAVVSQCIADLSHEAATITQNDNKKSSDEVTIDAIVSALKLEMQTKHKPKKERDGPLNNRY